MNILIVGFGGFVGAAGRYWLSGLVFKLFPSEFPVGTLVVNVLGCLAIGAVLYLVMERESIDKRLELLIVTGILGSLTTFSTFGFETFELLRQERVLSAGANIAANMVIGLLAVWIGWVLARTVTS